MILNNKVSQKLEIIGFKESVKKSTSRIQDIIHNYIHWIMGVQKQRK